MQTFLPYVSFIESAEHLDYRRLGKQRVEAFQILNSLKNHDRWYNHPAVKMWEGFEEALKFYCNCMIEEWVARGYRNNMKLYKINYDELVLPKWIGNEEFHKSHRAALLYKNHDFYSKFNWEEEPKLDYIWPTKKGE